MGVGTAVFTSHLFPLYVLRSPEAMLARFQAVLVTVQMVALLVGSALVGALAARWGVDLALGFGCVLCLLTAGPALLNGPLRTARTR